MANIVIERCPVCPNIGGRAQEVAQALKTDRGLEVQVTDGEKGEFAVYVDGVPVIRKIGDALPSVNEVERAVRNVPAGV